MIDEIETRSRKKARSRSMLLPGSGFAFLGYGGLAILGYATMFLVTASIVAVCFWPVPVTFWLVVGILVFLCAYSSIEYVATNRWEIREPDGSAGRSPSDAVILGTTVIIAALIGSSIFLKFGALQIAGKGMAPAVLEGERVLYHKPVDPEGLVRSGLVTFDLSKESAWGGPGVLVIARILAVPGDTLSKRDSHYLVNGKPGPEVSPTERGPLPLEIPEDPGSILVPPDCYFVIQEQPAKALDSQTFSWIRKGDLISTRHWLISSRGFFQPIR
jgi:signal peptidase I